MVGLSRINLQAMGVVFSSELAAKSVRSDMSQPFNLHCSDAVFDNKYFKF